MSESLFKVSPEDYTKPAVFLYSSKQISTKKMGELFADVDNFSKSLSALDLSPGDFVCTSIKDPYLDLVVLFTLTKLKIGMYATSSSLKQEDRVIKKVLPKYLFKELDSKRISFNKIKINNSSSNKLVSHKSREVPWVVRSSSGTTGEPKILITSHKHMLNRRERFFDAVNFSRNDSFYSFTEIAFGAARQRYFYVLSIGGAVLLNDSNAPIEEKIRQINEYKISHIYIVPMHLELLCDYAEKKGLKTPLFPFVRCMETTSSIVSEQLKTRVEKFLTDKFVISYAASEVGNITSTLKTDHYEEGSVGKPTDGVEVKIYTNQTDQTQLPDGQVGEIGLTIKDYVVPVDLNGGEEKAIFYPGDLGFISALGNLVFKGRSDDMMIYNGINIFPSEVEAVISNIEGVKEVVAFPLETRVNFQVPCVAFVLNKKINLQALMDRSKKILGSRSPQFYLKVDAIPRNPRGKVLRRELKQIAKEKFFKKGNVS